MLEGISRELFSRGLSITDAQIQEALDPVKNAYSKKVVGGTAPGEVDRQLDVLEAKLRADEALVDGREKALSEARAAMDREVDALVARAL